ncbi:hypothetical protein [Pseudonocardia sp.]|uniref:hypothetical protein n=1 Tax=Pseudonocardia sp. TaxID=60912 RepID=UPI003D1366AC
MTALTIPDPVDRDDLGAFTARIVRLDQVALVRLRAERRGEDGYVVAWAPTPFDALATRSVRGGIEPADTTVSASALLTALAVDRAATIDPGPALPANLADLPPEDGWAVVEDVPAAELDALAERGLAMARENAGPLGPPASLMDQTVLTVEGGAHDRVGGAAVKVPLRCLFALSGMGFLGAGAATDTVRVSATGSWLRLDARFGAVVRRRVTALPLIVP